MTDEEESIQVISETMTISGKGDLEPRVYLLIIPMEEGIAIKPIMIPKKLYVNLVSRMNRANSVLKGTIQNDETPNLGEIMRVMEELGTDGDTEVSSEAITRIKKFDHMFG